MIVSQLQVYNFRRFKSIDGKPGLSITFHEGLNVNRSTLSNWVKQLSPIKVNQEKMP